MTERNAKPSHHIHSTRKYFCWKTDDLKVVFKALCTVHIDGTAKAFELHRINLDQTAQEPKLFTFGTVVIDDTVFFVVSRH
jgi:hypothetical protein